LGQKDLRPKAAQLIVFLDGDERLRILLQEGESIFVGRVDGTNCVGLQRTISTERLRGISREHLKFSYIGDEITVVDPGSKNGTQIRSKRAGNRGLSAEPTRLGRSESLELPDGITIELSGRSQPFAGERPVDTPNAADAEVTRLRGGE
jgi:pSer/pThr/pTyr-binding forkhead associated (FHA) protein